MYETEEKRWRAVQTRDRAAASAFVYAVKTTRIFCRPTCPARLARRANVQFFDTPPAAVTAGYRPCKRCKPEESAGPSSPAKLVDIACAYLHKIQGEVTVDELATRVGVSSRYLHRIFGTEKGCTPAAYAAALRQQGWKSNSTSHEKNLSCNAANLKAFSEAAIVSGAQTPGLRSSDASPSYSEPSEQYDYYYSPNSYELAQDFLETPDFSVYDGDLAMFADCFDMNVDLHTCSATSDSNTFPLSQYHV